MRGLTWLVASEVVRVYSKVLQKFAVHTVEPSAAGPAMTAVRRIEPNEATDQGPSTSTGKGDERAAAPADGVAASRLLGHEVSNAATVAVMNLHCLNEQLAANRRRVARACRDAQRETGTAPPWAQALLVELDDMQATCGDGLAGVEHIVALVREQQSAAHAVGASGGAGLEQVAVPKLVEAAYRVVSAELRSHANVKMDLAASYVRGRPNRLRQLLVNLMLNAAAACTRGNNTIWLSARPDGDWVQLVVQDDGCGMSEELRQRIFDPFVTTKGNGRGIGLTLCQEIVQAHGGTLSCRSKENEGTSFLVRIPSAEAPTAGEKTWGVGET